MQGILDLVLAEVKKSFAQSGVKADIFALPNEIVVTIRAQELKQMLLEKAPLEWRPFIEIECGDIRVRFKMVMP